MARTASAAPPRRPYAAPPRRSARPACEVVVGFTCVRPAHVAAGAPGTFGYLVMHHGTCGYCPGQPDGRHQWARTKGVTLNELVRGMSKTSDRRS